MTQIHISIRKPKTGGLDPVTGTLRFRPVRRHFDAAKNLVIAASFDANLSEDGELTVDLLPTTPAFVWQVVELADSPQAYTRYVEVPNNAGTVEYADLVEVDAGTFVPKDMQGSQLLKVRRAATQSEAEALSDRIGILSHGRLRICGTAQELCAAAGETRFEEAFIKLAGEGVQ